MWTDEDMTTQQRPMTLLTGDASQRLMWMTARASSMHQQQTSHAEKV